MAERGFVDGGFYWVRQPGMAASIGHYRKERHGNPAGFTLPGSVWIWHPDQLTEIGPFIGTEPPRYVRVVIGPDEWVKGVQVERVKLVQLPGQLPVPVDPGDRQRPPRVVQPLDP